MNLFVWLTNAADWVEEYIMNGFLPLIFEPFRDFLIWIGEIGPILQAIFGFFST